MYNKREYKVNLRERNNRMIQSNAFNYINVLGKAADASWTRNSVIANNIANADTPNYKRQDVSFESYLSSTLHSSSVLDEAINNVDLASVSPTIYTDNTSVSYRVDGNNVDIDAEEAYSAQNQIKYEALIDSINQEFARLRSVVKSV